MSKPAYLIKSFLSLVKLHTTIEQVMIKIEIENIYG